MMAAAAAAVSAGRCAAAVAEGGGDGRPLDILEEGAVVLYIMLILMIGKSLRTWIILCVRERLSSKSSVAANVETP